MAKPKKTPKDSVDSKGIAARYLNACLIRLHRGDSFEDCLNFLQMKAKIEHPTASPDALKNCRGRWFEVLLVLLVNHATSKSDRVFLKLGTSNEHSIFQIFSNVAGIIAPKNFSINLSIPDMIVINGSQVEHVLKWKKQLLAYDPETQGESIVIHILGGYNVVKSTPIHTKTCVAFCSIKTSLRPDRKYQAMFEAESIRAMQKRIPGWNVKYFMVGPLEANKTKQILETNLSLIAFASQDINPYKTIDEIFTVNCWDSLQKFVSKI